MVIRKNYIDYDLVDILSYMVDAIYMDVEDPKGLQGNINYLSEEDKKSISDRAKRDRDSAIEAKQLEFDDAKIAIGKWREIFGTNFPIYTGD